METNNSNISTSSTSLADSCSGERYWFAFLFSSLATFLIGAIAILLWRCGALIYKRRPRVKYQTRRSVLNGGKHEVSYSFSTIGQRNWVMMIKDYAAKLISGQQMPGKILVCNTEINRIVHLLDYNCRLLQLLS